MIFSWQIRQNRFCNCRKTHKEKQQRSGGLKWNVSHSAVCVNAWSPSSGLCYFRRLSNLWEVAPVAWPHFLPAFCSCSGNTWGGEESHLATPATEKPHCHAFPSPMDGVLQTASPSKPFSPKLLLVVFFATQEVTRSESVAWDSHHLRFSEERSWDLGLWLWRAAGFWETGQRNGEPLVVSHRWGGDMQTETKYSFGRKNKQFIATTKCSYAHALKAGTSFLTRAQFFRQIAASHWSTVGDTFNVSRCM